jgi:pilus assembly protein CpaB
MRRGGRLFLLLGIVIAAAAALFLVFYLQQPQVPGALTPEPTAVLKKKIVVARIDIPNNTVLTDTETFLDLSEIPETEYNANPNQYFTSFSEVQGKLTLRPIQATELIRQNDVTDAGLSLQIPAAQANQPRPKAFAFAVNNVSGVADQIKPGDFVDVIASFRFTRVLLRPGFNETGQLIIKEDTVSDLISTKTLVQNVQVLKILKPAPPAEGTPTPGGSAPAQGPPQTDASGQPVGADQSGQAGTGQPGQTTTGDTLEQGQWMLLLAVTDQQAEIIKLSREQGNGITLVLRGRGDSTVETTIGATIDLLVSQFGLPLPNPAEPAFFSPNQLTPLPTVVGTTAPATTPTPTVTPTP